MAANSGRAHPFALDLAGRLTVGECGRLAQSRGATRFHRSVDEQEVRKLASFMDSAVRFGESPASARVPLGKGVREWAEVC